jgi:hypothetical protein
MQETDQVATGRAVILEIVRAMRANIEPLMFSTVAPTRYYVYLHPDDHKRLEGVFPLVVDQARRALDDEVRRVNEKAKAGPLRKWLSSEPAEPAIDAPRDGWEIRFEPDLDGEMQPGDIAVASELILPSRDELAGSRTRRVTTMQSGGKTSRREQVVEGPGTAPVAPGGTTFATLTYEDRQGPHRFAMTKTEVVVGRGGVGYWVDLKLDTLADVSREHLRLRRDEATGAFFLKDLSSLGTTLDGKAVPSSVEIVDGQRKDKGVEVPVPPRARIGLADTVYLDFEAVPATDRGAS